MASHGMVGRLVCPGYEDLGIPPLYVHDLTGTEDADRLLRKPPLMHPAAPEVLPKLWQWNPEVAAAFSEKDSAVSRIPFKLITTHQQWDSGKVNSFVAVSYCWHNEYWEIPARFSDAAPKDWSVPVSPAMLKALLASIDDGEAIWMDQFCIDQDDSQQKAHAIANMDTIYRNADSVLILLEDIDIAPDVEQSFHLLASTPAEPENITSERLYLSTTAFAENYASCFDQGATRNLFDFSTEVFDCRWFARAWCCQEYQLNANRVFIFVGHRYLSIGVYSSFFSDFHYQSSSTSGETHDLYTIPGFQAFSFGIGTNGPDEINELNLSLLFIELDQLSCSYSRDTISIALNVSGLLLSFNKDITEKYDRRFILSLILLTTGDPAALHTIGPPLHKQLPAPNYQGVIRWPEGPDFRYWDDWDFARLTSSPKFGHICQESMILDLFLLQSKPRAPRKEALDMVKVRWMAPQDLPSELAGIAVTLFAVALDLGLSWMVQSVRNFAEERRLVRGTVGARYMGISESVIQVAPSTEDVPEMISKLLLRFRNVEWTVPLIVRLNKESTQHAIVFIPSRLAKHVLSGSTQFIFAVPAALNSSGAACLRRLWILRRTQTFEHFLSIEGQGFYFGQDLKVDGEVTYAEEVSVVGRWNDDFDCYDSADEWADTVSGVPELEIEWKADGRH